VNVPARRRQRRADELLADVGFAELLLVQHDSPRGPSAQTPDAPLPKFVRAQKVGVVHLDAALVRQNGSGPSDNKEIGA
jgi:hypothetical protein